MWHLVVPNVPVFKAIKVDKSWDFWGLNGVGNRADFTSLSISVSYKMLIFSLYANQYSAT